jgi:hypothetical protein
MKQRESFRRSHPVFFWGMLTVIVVLLAATAVVFARVPEYQRETASLDREMSEQERSVRDRVLESRARRSQLAVAMLQREIRMKALQEKGLHLAISMEDSMLYLRHGPATLRQIRVSIGSDSTVRADDGRSWRLVRPLGERFVAQKQTTPSYTVPEWVYVSRGEPVPPEAERTLAGALGRYVLRLNDGAEVYSEPASGPLAGRVKPAGFMVPEAEFRAIFDAVRQDMPVFIY